MYHIASITISRGSITNVFSKFMYVNVILSLGRGMVHCLGAIASVDSLQSA
jgi:hypothetical protein